MSALPMPLVARKMRQQRYVWVDVTLSDQDVKEATALLKKCADLPEIKVGKKAKLFLEVSIQGA